MAAVRLRSEMVSQENILWRVDIYDEDYSGSVVLVEGQDGFIEYEKQGDIILEPMHASEATLLVYHRDSYTGEFQDFVNDLLGADELRFKMLVYKDGVFNWAGNVIIDNCGYENAPNPRIFEIRATDGLGRLKNIPFLSTIPATPSFNSWGQYIIDALAFNELAQFWAAPDPYIRESFEFLENRKGALTGVESMFTQTRYSDTLNIKNLKDIDINDTTRVRSAVSRGVVSRYVEVQDTDEMLTAYQVIENLMILTCCRFFISDGAYHIQQVRNLDGTSYTIRNFSKNSTATVATTGTISPRQTTGKANTGKELDVLGGGRIDFMQPLLKAIVKTPNTYQASILKPANITVPSSAISGPITDTLTVELGTIVSTGVEKIGVNWVDVFTALLPIAYDVLVTLTFKLILDETGPTVNNRLLSAGGTPNIMSWTTTAADVVTRFVSPSIMGYADIPIERSFLSPEIPSGTYVGSQLVITVSMGSRAGITMPAASSLTYVMRSINLSLSDGNTFSSGETYHSDNNTDNSTVMDFGTLLLSDTGLITNLNAFEVNTTDWFPTGTWDAGFGTDTSLAKTIVQEAISLQRLPVERRQMSLKGDWSAYKVAYYDDKVFVFNGGKQRFSNDTVEGEWFELLIDKTSVAIDRTIIHQKINPDRYPGVETAPKTWKDWKDDSDDFDSTMMSIRTFKATGGSTTSLDIFAPGHNLLKAGDKLSIIDPQNGVETVEVVLSANVGSADTTISIVSQVLGVDVLATSRIRHNPKEVVASAKGRFDELQMVSAPKIKVTTANASTHDIETDQYKISSTYSQTGTQVIELPLASDCWDSDLSAGLEFVIFDTDGNASINNITIQVEAGSGDTITDIQTGQSSVIIGEDGFDITIQCISATEFKAT